jgi:hypothetical protein
MRNRTSLVWALLVAMTSLSWALGSGHDLGASGQQTASVVVLVLALLKARLVGVHFMALRNAPTSLRAAFETWCLLVGALTITLFVVG